MKSSEREKLKTSVLKYVECCLDLRKFPDLYDEESKSYSDDLAGQLIVELFDEGRLDLGYSISKRDGKIRQDMENLSQTLKVIRSVDRVIPMQSVNKKKVLFDELKSKEERSNQYPIDAINSFAASLSRDYYDKTKAGKALGVTRQTIDNWLAKSHLGLKTELRGSRKVITREEMVRFYSELSKEKL
jgi:hypothetical protein